jgi:hypothetical protein
MSSFVPAFAFPVSFADDWISVPVSMMPIGYRVQMRRVGKTFEYRLKLPGGGTRRINSPSEGREIARRLADESTPGIEVWDNTDFAALGLAIDCDDNPILLLFVGEKPCCYVSLEEGREILAESGHAAVDTDYADAIDTLSSNSLGLLIDLNTQGQWGVFSDNGTVYSDRFAEVDEVVTFSRDLT